MHGARVRQILVRGDYPRHVQFVIAGSRQPDRLHMLRLHRSHCDPMPSPCAPLRLPGGQVDRQVSSAAGQFHRRAFVRNRAVLASYAQAAAPLSHTWRSLHCPKCAARIVCELQARRGKAKARCPGSRHFEGPYLLSRVSRWRGDSRPDVAFTFGHPGVSGLVREAPTETPGMCRGKRRPVRHPQTRRRAVPGCPGGVGGLAVCRVHPASRQQCAGQRP